MTSATILAVDDTPESLALLVDTLAREGYQMRAADSGELALAAAAMQPPDLILLDLRMPGMDGLEVCRRLKAQEATRPIPIILLSAFAEVQEWAQGLQLGAVDYITKPFQAEELLARVRTQLTLHRAQVALAQQAAALRESEANLQAILASTADGILAIDIQRKILHINERFAEMWHIPQDLIDSGMDEALLDFVLGRLVEPLIFLAKVEAIYASDLEGQDTCLLKDGRIFERHSLPMMLDGSVTGRVWSFRDITERKRAEKRLQESEQRYQDLFQFNPHAMFTVDQETRRFLAVNRVAVSQFGYSEYEFLAMTIMDILSPEELPRLSLDLAKSASEDPQSVGSWKHKKRDGSLLDIEISYQELMHDGRLARVVVATDVTTRKQAEVALRESEEQTRAIEQSAHDAIVTSDIHGKIVSWNRGAESLFGYTRSEAMGQPLIILIPERYRERHLAGMNRFHSGGPHQVSDKPLELVGLRKDQREFLLELSLAKWETSRGWHVTAIIRDITERKQAEGARQELANRLQKIASMVPGVVYQFLLRPDGSACFPYASEGLRDMFGFDPEEVREDASRLLALVHPDDQDGFITSIQDSARTLLPWSHEYRVQLAGGIIRTLLGQSVPQREADGSVLWHGSCLDITERKAIDRAIIQSELRFRSVFDNSPVAMSLHRIEDDLILQVNDAWTQLFGWTEPETIGHTLGDLDYWFNPEDRHRVLEEFKEVGTLTDWPLHARRKDGTTMHLRMAVSALQVQGEPCVLAVLLDHTKLHQAKQALIQLNQSLEYRVAQELNHRMAQERMLVHQSRLAAMGEMIGNIAHQWRQPLNALSMILANLKDEGRFGTLDPAVLEKPIATGNELIQKMSRTINDFTGFFRPDKVQTAFSALEQVRETLSLLEASLTARNIAFEIEAPTDVKLFGYPNEYSQVLLNLVNNAKDAIQEAGIETGRICISLTQDGGYGCLTMRDNGGGIPEEYLDRIFEPYFSTRESGTGIGLYMSRQIIEGNMKGQLTARNVAGGAALLVRVPIAGGER